jgi:hypothetical protein
VLNEEENISVDKCTGKQKTFVLYDLVDEA